ncbi:hypothetical protein R0131_01785 [Clostridium sp. AL.422]|uniref:hypothetical protein n=1 Tax=Clostridium TaxID=1485 RepID=UPI00293DAD0C|nr:MULTISPECIES: hypothetical protein [unclassified Clostridium]MDV4149557.1 hypothetical protein [Clostridium sp. AL.422]
MIIYRGPRYYLIDVFLLSIVIFWIGVSLLGTNDGMISYLLSVIVSDLILKNKGKIKS